MGQFDNTVLYSGVSLAWKFQTHPLRSTTYSFFNTTNRKMRVRGATTEQIQEVNQTSYMKVSEMGTAVKNILHRIDVLIKYVGKYKDGEIKARNGGMVVENDSEKGFLALRNTRAHNRASWSVQYSNLKDENQLVGVYYKPDNVDEKEKEKEEESKEPKRVRDLTDKEKEKILNKLYYVEQKFCR